MVKRNAYSIELLAEVIKSSFSVAQVLQKLGLVAAGGNYMTVKKLVAQHNLCTSHFTGQKTNSGPSRKGGTVVVPLEKILVSNSFYSRTQLKKRLVKTGLLENVCNNCNSLPEWKNSPMILILDHINGVNNDNRLENLRLLCPNCNSQTPTFCGRNKIAAS